MCLASAANGGITLVLAKAVSTLIVCFFSFPFLINRKIKKVIILKNTKVIGKSEMGDTVNIASWQGAVVTSILLVSICSQIKLINDSLAINDALFHVTNMLILLSLFIEFLYFMFYIGSCIFCFLVNISILLKKKKNL